jgi:hypothetical protein
MTTDTDAGLDITRAEFERACSLLPPDFTWGLPVTPRLVLEVANALACTPSAQEEAVRVTWISVDDEKPPAEWDKYYEDDFSAPVAVMIDYNGHVRRSEITWRYSFAHGGWVQADLREGWKPEDYSDCGRVTHWAPLPDPLTAPAASAGDQGVDDGR